ncbi:uncharacterized protein N0V89_012073 [Didymosphaeria variabile]|uniref:Uncharacterized protein n=1 Tax=Didymosphaeria variabile TaxID=1932322 RepID=A0A9W8XAW4_9PLEO|nr:uncharacterized protein N0V89_012073 [Didymosphaeria variabile]KAJ4345937.1 hypothetical protein N0V89_012073 [Didymosphaeria variabile]
MLGAAERDVKLDVDVVARLALSNQLGAGGVEERRGAAVVIGGIVSTGEEYDRVKTFRGELGGFAGLRGDEADSAKSEESE